MSRTSTRKASKEVTKSPSGNSERLLLAAILFLGILGLAISYSSKSSSPPAQSASSADTTRSDGKLRSDHMILHLNQRGENNEQQQQRKMRF